MEIKLKVGQMRRMSEMFKMSGDFAKMIPRFRDDKETVTFDHAALSKGDLDFLFRFSAEERKANPKVVNGLAQKLGILTNLEKNLDKIPIARLDQLAEAIKQYVRKNAIDHWLYRVDKSDRVLPYLVKGVSYHPAESRSGFTTAAYVQVDLEYIAKNDNHDTRIHISAEDLKESRRTVQKLLEAEGYFVGTPELQQAYTAAYERYGEVKMRRNEQFLGRGRAFSVGEDWWGGQYVTLDKDGTPAKLVNEEDAYTSGRSRRNSEEENALDHTRSLSWLPRIKKDADDEPVYPLGKIPDHMYIYMYNLDTDDLVWAHADGIADYVYDPTMKEKIVLPEADREIIDILTTDVANNIEDIVAGKSGGTVIVAKGAPGTGKTLTAEVYAEVIQRPLYKVRSYALGLNIETIEKNLSQVLSRAQRWGAVLLIDEADIYIHERGEDMHQNAVVGVFLRVLEYYNGLLIMTTNRGTVIDDAILSRATAVIDYSELDADRAFRVWEILVKQFKIETIDLKLMHDLSVKYPSISGRSIKGLLKLASKYVKMTGQPYSVKVFEHCAKYQLVS